MTRAHIVRPGECMESIAADHGVSSQSLWSHPGNEGLRERREHPGVLRQGDIVAVPEPVPGPEVVCGQTHRFSARRPRAKLALSLEGDDGRPAAALAYRLVVGQLTMAGSTGADGELTEMVPATAREARLILEPDTERMRSLTLQLGALDPLDGLDGVKQRLANLGYPREEELREFGEGRTEQLARALTQFQGDEGLDETGEADEATRRRLRERHGT